MNTIQSEKYILEGYCSEELNITFNCPYGKHDVLRLQEALNWEHLEIGLFYENLTLAEEEILRNMLPDWSQKTNSFVIREGSLMDFLSYTIHAGRELELMLEGRKPLSVFVDTEVESHETIPESSFDGFVKKGKLIKREFMITIFNEGVKVNLRYVLYSQPDEEWRINAYMENVEVVNREGLSRSTEEREGMLLGYTEEQNQEYLRLFDQFE